MKIKGMDKNMKCRGGFQFEVGEEYKIEHDGKPLKVCSDTVFHYCDSLQKVHDSYDCAKGIKNRYFEIEVLGEEVTDGAKCGSDHIRIAREILGEELEILKGHINGNTGLFNSGYDNSGNDNSGNDNSGNRNSGNNNSGNDNSGNRNSGNNNSGNDNSGNDNSGNRNSGNDNSGYWNSGDRSSGNCNSGDDNSGYWNSGDRNSGNNNSGFGNSCNGSNGVFCTEEDANIRIFNHPSGMSLSDFHRSEYYDALISAPFRLTEWIENEQGETFLQTYTMEEAWARWWNELTEDNKEIIMQMPNFDKGIFKEITGIEVE